MKKQVLYFLMGCVLLLCPACRSTTKLQSGVESRVEREETFVEAKVDSLIERVTDSVFVFVAKNDSMTHTLKETVRWKEKVKVVKDTVVVYVRTDTLNNAVEVVEKTNRSPPLRQPFLTMILWLTIATAIKCLIKKRKENYYEH